MIEVLLLLILLISFISYMNGNFFMWSEPTLSENFPRGLSYIKTCQMFPYLTKCLSYYGNYDNQADAVMRNFMTANGHVDSYKWLNQFNSMKYNINNKII